MFTGLAIPNWVLKNPKAIATGIIERRKKRKKRKKRKEAFLVYTLYFND